MPNRPNWRSIKMHRPYSVDEAARTLGVHKATVRRWLKKWKVPIFDDQKPVLIRGEDLKSLGNQMKKPSSPCRVDQAYCLKCRKPTKAAYGEWEIADATGTAANMRMLCGTCTTIVYKRVAWRDLITLSKTVRVSARQNLRHLIEMQEPCLNVHYLKGA
jgi:excisionase family DNA binding protein